MNIDRLYDPEQFRQAVHHCWVGRQKATNKQVERGDAIDVGARSGVTSGKHLDPLTKLIGDIFVAAGMPTESIYYKSMLELPGYYRAEKKWDLVVIYEGELVAAVELKSILSSFGNNMNNRTEEALGNAQDLLTAYEEGRFADNSRAPWLGYVFVVQAELRSTKPVAIRRPHFDVDPQFIGASYLERAELLCRRLVQKRIYSASCLITSGGTDPSQVSTPSPDLSFKKFVAGIFGRVTETLA